MKILETEQGRALDRVFQGPATRPCDFWKKQGLQGYRVYRVGSGRALIPVDFEKLNPARPCGFFTGFYRVEILCKNPQKIQNLLKNLLKFPKFSTKLTKIAQIFRNLPEKDIKLKKSVGV